MRPVKQSSIIDKKFDQLLELPIKVGKTLLNPTAVIGDLQQGSLTSLGRYLKQHGGIDDPGIAIELRKLISGSARMTPFRIVVVDHPNAAKAKGGRPKRPAGSLTDRQLSIATEFRKIGGPGLAESAAKTVADQFGVTVATVYKCVARLREREAQEDEQRLNADQREKNAQRHQRALEALRKASQSDLP